MGNSKIANMSRIFCPEELVQLTHLAVEVGELVRREGYMCHVSGPIPGNRDWVDQPRVKAFKTQEGLLLF